MREFILLARRAFTKPFKLNDLPGSGRIDLIARCITSAIFISEALRRDVNFFVVMEGPPEPPKTIVFETKTLKRVYPDERNIASHINIALEKFTGNENWVETEPGIKIAKKSFEKLVKERKKNTNVFYLSPKGTNIEKFKFENNVCFIIGDHVGLDKKREIFLKKNEIPFVSLGNITYLSSQVIAILHYLLDKQGV